MLKQFAVLWIVWLVVVAGCRSSRELSQSLEPQTRTSPESVRLELLPTPAGERGQARVIVRVAVGLELPDAYDARSVPTAIIGEAEGRVEFLTTVPDNIPSLELSPEPSFALRDRVESVAEARLSSHESAAVAGIWEVWKLTLLPARDRQLRFRFTFLRPEQDLWFETPELDGRESVLLTRPDRSSFVLIDWQFLHGDADDEESLADSGVAKSSSRAQGDPDRAEASEQEGGLDARETEVASASALPANSVAQIYRENLRFPDRQLATFVTLAEEYRVDELSQLALVLTANDRTSLAQNVTGAIRERGIPREEQRFDLLAATLATACQSESFSQKPAVFAFLTQSVGQLARYPATVVTLLGECGSIEDWQKRVIEENRFFLRDRELAARVRAADYLRRAAAPLPEHYAPYESPSIGERSRP